MDDNPYRSPTARLEDAVPELDFVLADRGTRLGVVIIDALLSVLVVLPLMGLFFFAFFASGGFSGKAFPELVQALSGGLGYLVQLGMAAFGFVMFLALQGWPLAQYGQTWGKRWFGIRIVDLQGRKPEFLRLVLLRYGVGQLVGLIPCLGLIYGLTDALFIFRDDRRCVHDLLAGTRVVVGSPPARGGG